MKIIQIISCYLILIKIIIFTNNNWFIVSLKKRKKEIKYYYCISIISLNFQIELHS